MTPVRNEAWVLHAFLKVTSIWADYIIIADQSSTDGSREIALSYPKVIIVENENQNYNEDERQKILIKRAREIEGDKILFGLDADEIFSANFAETDDWQRILNSKPGDVFWFKWAEICQDLNTYWESVDTYFPWVFHDDGIEPHGNYVRNMHSMRIPYPIEEKQMYYVNDFRVLHLAYINALRVNAKRRFYIYVDWSLNQRSIMKLSRMYSSPKTEPVFRLTSEMIAYRKLPGFSLFEEIDITLKSFWFDTYVFERIRDLRDNNIYKLDIWENEFMQLFDLSDNRSMLEKLIHRYLQNTHKVKKYLLIRFIDKVLSKFI